MTLRAQSQASSRIRGNRGKVDGPGRACDEVERIIAERVPRNRFAVVSNPEFLREGAAIEDFKQPERVVIGVEDERARLVMAKIYEPLSLVHAPIIYTSRRSSELIRYAANVFLAMKVTFINEIADLCERVDADVLDVSRGVGLDSRIGPKFLSPGFDSLRLWSKSTTRAWSQWPKRSSRPATARLWASGSQCSALLTSLEPMICAKRRAW